MPIYVFKCPSCKKTFDRYLKLADYRVPQTCSCGETAEKQVVAPFVQVDIPAYECPVTGKRIEGRKEHQRNLEAHGCRVLEPGETKQVSERRKLADEELENKLAESAAEFVAKLPPKKQEQLAIELEHGADVEIVRV